MELSSPGRGQGESSRSGPVIPTLQWPKRGKIQELGRKQERRQVGVSRACEDKGAGPWEPRARQAKDTGGQSWWMQQTVGWARLDTGPLPKGPQHLSMLPPLGTKPVPADL